MLSKRYSFIKALPVWAAGREREMNLTLNYTATLPKTTAGEDVVLALAASCTYEIFVNGDFLAAGPARCAHGFFRVDEFNLGKLLQDRESNVLEIRVAGYYTNCFMTLQQPSFLCAEVRSGEDVLRWTAPEAGDFTGKVFAPKVQKVQRYCIQRPFVECYDYRKEDDTEPVSLAISPAGTFLERGVPYGDFSRISVKEVVASGKTTKTDREPTYMWSITDMAPIWDTFPVEELEACTTWDAEKLDFVPENQTVKPWTPGAYLPANTYGVYDMGREITGMIGLTVTCKAPVTIYALFDELLQEDATHPIDFVRLYTSSVVVWHLPAGTHRLLTAEPYSFRYLQLVSLEGACIVDDLYVRGYTFKAIPSKKFRDPDVQKIYDAAIETFRQNVVDIYMDCPHRERAGWLCDSFFTSRVEHLLTGEVPVERNFLEHFLLPDSFAHLPEGMLPMCYPSDHRDGKFIPNWAMWYVVELEEYLGRTGDRELVDAAKDRMYALLTYFRRFENEFGLLENLESWVLLEHSRASEFTQDVNFPSNFMYAAMKKTMGRLYDDAALYQEGEALLQTARDMALSTGSIFFSDNAVRKDGKLVVTEGVCSEVCQYYAFYFGAATPEQNPELYRVLIEDFGPQRKEINPWPNVYYANAFIGNYLRLDLLWRWGLRERLLEEIKGYFTFMTDRTGTLWEVDLPTHSCNHGFASYVAVWLSDFSD